jgi:hypothetical protein
VGIIREDEGYGEAKTPIGTAAGLVGVVTAAELEADGVLPNFTNCLIVAFNGTVHCVLPPIPVLAMRV